MGLLCVKLEEIHYLIDRMCSSDLKLALLQQPILTSEMNGHEFDGLSGDLKWFTGRKRGSEGEAQKPSICSYRGHGPSLGGYCPAKCGNWWGGVKDVVREQDIVS